MKCFSLLALVLLLQQSQSFHVSSSSRSSPAQAILNVNHDTISVFDRSFQPRQRRTRPTSSRLNLSLLSEVSAPTLNELLQNTDVWVFLAGVFPFAWATVEFWRRIASGESFGTGTDSVIIGVENSPEDSRGQRVLGKDALITAYILFALAFGTLGIVIYSVLSSGPTPEFLPPSTAAGAILDGTIVL